MASSIATVGTFAGGAVLITLLLPIWFDAEFPTGDSLTLIDKSLCIIIPNGGGNYTCIVPDDVVYFNGTGINIFANDTLRTVFFEVTPNGTTNCANIGAGEGICAGKVFSDLQFKSLIGGTDVTITSDANSITIDFVGMANITNAINVGTGAEVFKQNNNGTLEFRSINADNPMSVTQNTNDITIDWIACPDGEGYIYNATFGDFECTNISTISTDEDVQVKEGGINVGSPRNINFVDTNDFIILEDVGNNEIDIAINRDGVFGIPSLDSTALMTWTRINFTLSDIHDMANVGLGPCANDEILKFNTTSGQFECRVDAGGAGVTTLANLTDVTITDIANSNTLHYNSTTGVWENINATSWLDDSFNCSDNQIIKFNGTTNMWECAEDGGGAGGFFPLGNLTDVTITNLMDGDYLSYNATTLMWENVILNATASGTCQSPYGMIYSNGAPASQVIGASYVQVNQFDSNGISQDTTPSHTNDEITIDETGVYYIFVQISEDRGATNHHWEGAIFVNGIERQEIQFTERPQGANDSGSMSASGVLSLTAGDDVDVRVQGTGAGQDFDVNEAQLVVVGTFCEGAGGGQQGGGGSNDIKEIILTAGGATNQSPLSIRAVKGLELGTNLDYIALHYDDVDEEYAVWNWHMHDNADTADDFTVEIRFTQDTGSGGGICFEGSFRGVAVGEAIDGAFSTTQTVCDTSLDTAGDINQATLTFTPAQHGLSADDQIYFKLLRDVSNGSDTHTSEALVQTVKIEWN